MRLNVTSFQPIICSHFCLTPTSGDQQLEYESWGFIEVNCCWGADRIWHDSTTVHSMYGYMTICSVSFRRNWHSCWNRCVSGGFAVETMLFEHKLCRQSFSLKVVGWNGTGCLLSSWVLVVKNVQHQQHHAKYQQPTCIMQCSFHNVSFLHGF